MIKRLSLYFVLAALAIAAGFLGGVLAEHRRATSSLLSTPTSVRAKRFEVVDEGGRVVAELTAHALNLLDNSGRIRATLRLEQNDNGELAFSDGKWEGRAVFGFSGSDTPSQSDDDWGVLILNPQHMPVVSLGTTDTGRRGGLYVASKKGSRNVSAP